jgi:hypothetical protein
VSPLLFLSLRRPSKNAFAAMVLARRSCLKCGEKRASGGKAATLAAYVAVLPITSHLSFFRPARFMARMLAMSPRIPFKLEIASKFLAPFVG